jgi:hypothetical protein
MVAACVMVVLVDVKQQPTTSCAEFESLAKDGPHPSVVSHHVRLAPSCLMMGTDGRSLFYFNKKYRNAIFDARGLMNTDRFGVVSGVVTIK